MVWGKHSIRNFILIITNLQRNTVKQVLLLPSTDKKTENQSSQIFHTTTTKRQSRGLKTRLVFLKPNLFSLYHTIYRQHLLPSNSSYDFNIPIYHHSTKVHSSHYYQTCFIFFFVLKTSADFPNNTEDFKFLDDMQDHWGFV